MPTETGGTEMPSSAEPRSLTAIRRFARDEFGATAIEYALIASGISIVIFAVVNTLGATTAGLYQNVVTALK
jgi:pilus assembly protein Flp/PilA